MGNSSSTQLVVTCEKQHYSSGDVVRGVAGLNLTRELHATGVELKVRPGVASPPLSPSAPRGSLGRHEAVWEPEICAASPAAGCPATPAPPGRNRSAGVSAGSHGRAKRCGRANVKQVSGYERCKFQESETHHHNGHSETRWVTRDAEHKFYKVTVSRRRLCGSSFLAGRDRAGRRAQKSPAATPPVVVCKPLKEGTCHGVVPAGRPDTSPPNSRPHHPPCPKVPLGPGGTLPPGQYQWGFAFQLPEGLPSNFEYKKGDTQ